MDMGKKWRENRIRLFHTKFDKTLSREENIRNPPLSIPPTEWAAFIDYRLEEDTMKKSKQNAANRAKLTINHTGGSKKLKRRSEEIMSQTGKPVSRGTLYIETQKRRDGSYINEEARQVCEKIAEIESQGTAPVEVTIDDSLGQVKGAEHYGRVRAI
ncbi:uncharacterized protein LOC130712910 [Lotus japonicus]|uniref:uncharacterized protein LOC130712910 n=1 Tax=Lotus japonicus TaxID=34305 RepID=UPI0025875A0E|nr:uncharacterized protein LOC130712910 [Lotus japonicus]